MWKQLSGLITFMADSLGQGVRPDLTPSQNKEVVSGGYLEFFRPQKGAVHSRYPQPAPVRITPTYLQWRGYSRVDDYQDKYPKEKGGTFLTLPLNSRPAFDESLARLLRLGRKYRGLKPVFFYSLDESG